MSTIGHLDDNPTSGEKASPIKSGIMGGEHIRQGVAGAERSAGIVENGGDCDEVLLGHK
jgi:hypothetical protein